MSGLLQFLPAILVEVPAESRTAPQALCADDKVSFVLDSAFLQPTNALRCAFSAGRRLAFDRHALSG